MFSSSSMFSAAFSSRFSSSGRALASMRLRRSQHLWPWPIEPTVAPVTFPTVMFDEISLPFVISSAASNLQLSWGQPPAGLTDPLTLLVSGHWILAVSHAERAEMLFTRVRFVIRHGDGLIAGEHVEGLRKPKPCFGLAHLALFR